jgi:DNA-binding MarR family transcriptional regulator
LRKRDPFDSREQEAFLNLVRTYEALASEFDALFKAHGISDSQYNVLRILRGAADAKEQMGVYDIAERMLTRQPDMTRLIHRMEQAGLVERKRCEADRRIVWVTLTRRGKVLVNRLDTPVIDLHRLQLGHLGARRLAELSRLLFDARQNRASKE